MALNIPTSTQWITFPTRPGDAFYLQWSEGKIAKKATYYCTTCYYGSLTADDAKKAEDDAKKLRDAAAETARKAGSSKTASALALPVSLKSDSTLGHVVGKSQIFVATEYLEAQYRGGPLKLFHLLDAADVKKGEESSWVKFQLNECFRYGQDASKDQKVRYIVYHPPVAKGIKPPRIFQHRFTGLTSADIAKAAAQELPEYAPSEWQAAAKAGGMLADYGIGLLRGSVGHYLHKFLDEAGIQEAAARESKADKAKLEEARKKAVAAKVGVLQAGALRATDEDADWREWKRLVALQYVEMMRAAKENEDTDAALEARLSEQAEARRKAMADAGKIETFFKKTWAWATKAKPQKGEKYKDTTDDEATKELKKAFEAVKDAAKEDQVQIELDFEEDMVDVSKDLVLPLKEDTPIIKKLGEKRGSILIDHASLNLDLSNDSTTKTEAKPEAAEKSKSGVERNTISGDKTTNTTLETTNKFQPKRPSKPQAQDVDQQKNDEPTNKAAGPHDGQASLYRNTTGFPGRQNTGSKKLDPIEKKNQKPKEPVLH